MARMAQCAMPRRSPVAASNWDERDSNGELRPGWIGGGVRIVTVARGWIGGGVRIVTMARGWIGRRGADRDNGKGMDREEGCGS